MKATTSLPEVRDCGWIFLLCGANKISQLLYRSSLERRTEAAGGKKWKTTFTFQGLSQTNLHNSGITFNSLIKSTEYLAATFSMWKDVKGHSGLSFRVQVYTVLDEGIRKEVERRGDGENTCFWFSSAGEEDLIDRFFFFLLWFGTMVYSAFICCQHCRGPGWKSQWGERRGDERGTHWEVD